ncbi:MAG TPA: winged helix-turn-helix domain-containing protein [Sphingomonas sp.]|nr:winged helix-turn-helix domain-containing protein [Sphingomonas sp.]
MEQTSRIAPRPIRLADEPDFSIGGLRVRPSSGEVEHGNVSERLEPRLMQVLITLTRADGGTVSREELTARCWGGVTVSPDAVNRVISLLRRLIAASAPTSRLETLPRIGYRLIQPLRVDTVAPDPAPPASKGGSAPIADPLARDLFARALVGLEQPSREPLEQALAYLKQLITRAPEFAPGWAALAEAQRLLMLYLPAPMQGPARAESSRSVDRALALDPGLGQAYGTLANLVPRFNNWAEIEALFQKGLANAPDSVSLRHLHAHFLLSVGCTQEAVERLTVLRKISRLSPAIALDLAGALFDIGRDTDAITAMEEAYALWPGIMLVWSECVRMNVVARRYDRVQSLLDAPPPGVAPDDPNLARRRLHLIAKRDRRPADMAAAHKNFTDFARIGIAPATVAIHALTTLDQPEAALEIADQIFRSDPPQAQGPGVNMMSNYTLAGQPDSVVLFRRDTSNLRELAGFATILERTGLEDYWRHSASQPDFRGALGR